MQQGWIKLHRDLLDSNIWTKEKFSKGQAWVDLLLLANHKTTVFSIRGIDITVKRGQLAWSKQSLMKRWRWSQNKVTTLLSFLKRYDKINVQNNNVTTIITILNYDNWQGTDDQSDDQMDTKRYTYKNVKNEKKIITYSKEFEEFFSAYPKKFDKERVNKVWNDLEIDDLLHWKIITSLNKQKESEDWTKDGGQYIPSPLKWLEGKRWQDEVFVPKPKKRGFVA